MTSNVYQAIQKQLSVMLKYDRIVVKDINGILTIRFNLKNGPLLTVTLDCAIVGRQFRAFLRHHDIQFEFNQYFLINMQPDVFHGLLLFNKQLNNDGIL